MGNWPVYRLVAILAVTGAALFFFKWLVLGYPLTPNTWAEAWDVEVRVRFVADDGPVKVALFIPSNLYPYSIMDENFVSHGYGLMTARTAGNRKSVWSIRHASGVQSLYYRALIQRIEIQQQPTIALRNPPQADELILPEPILLAARALLAEARAHSADTDTLVANLLLRLRNPGRDTNAALLVGAQADADKRIQAAIQVLSLDRIPARLVHGVRLEAAGRDVPIVPWLQAYDGQQWRYFNPDSGEAMLPADFLVLWSGPEQLVSISGGRNPDIAVSVRQSEQAAIQAAEARSNIMIPQLSRFSLLSLPVQTQEVYRILLLIPVGALLLVIARNLVGIKTFGTFMPVLIALAFRETELLWGLILFTVVVALGLVVRFYLERLRLLVVPRLAAILTVVVLLMALISVISNMLGMERGLSVALFPMVILTMTIERMTIVWEEQGSAEAMRQGMGSLLVASLAHLVMRIPELKHLIFMFPELLLIILAVLLLLGRYSGYRLTELIRFRALLGGKP